MSGYDYPLGASTIPHGAVPPSLSWWALPDVQQDREAFRRAVLERLPAMNGSHGDRVHEAILLAPWPGQRT